MRRVLTDGDLVLRPLVARDAGELFMLADAHRTTLRRFMTWLDRTTAVADVSFYILNLDGFWKNGLTYGIFQDDTLLGTVGFHNADHRNDKAEIGYWLAPPFWGQGLATEAGHALVSWLEESCGAKQFTSGYFADNPASGRVLEKLGFRKSHNAPLFCLGRGRDVDHVFMVRGPKTR